MRNVKARFNRQENKNSGSEKFVTVVSLFPQAKCFHNSVDLIF